MQLRFSKYLNNLFQKLLASGKTAIYAVGRLRPHFPKLLTLGHYRRRRSVHLQILMHALRVSVRVCVRGPACTFACVRGRHVPTKRPWQ